MRKSTKVDSKLAALVIQDQPLFHVFIWDIGDQDNQPVTERHHLHEYVHFVKYCVQNAKEEYTERLNNSVEPLKQEFCGTKQ